MHTSFVQTHIDFREFKVSLFDVQPNIGISPIVDGIELAAFCDTLHLGVGDALKAGQTFCRAQADQLNAVTERLFAERLVVHLSGVVQVWAVPDGKIGRGAHPHIFFARLPCYPRFRRRKVVYHAYLLERQAKP